MWGCHFAKNFSPQKSSPYLEGIKGNINFRNSAIAQINVLEVIRVAEVAQIVQSLPDCLSAPCICSKSCLARFDVRRRYLEVLLAQHIRKLGDN